MPGPKLLVLSSLLLNLILGGHAGFAATDPVTGELLGSTFTVQVDGKTMPTTSYEDMDHMAFNWTKPVNITIARTDGRPIAESRIRPLRLGIPGTVSQASLSFKLDKPQYLVINIDKLRKLVIIPKLPDPDRPNLKQPGVVNVLDRGADNTGKADNTAILQKAIDDLPTHGTLYFPAGQYRTGSLNLKSDMTLYVDDNALIKGSDDFKLHQFRNSFLYFIKVEDAQNVRILGHGIIDGNGGPARLAWQQEKKARKVAGRCFVSVNVKNLTLKNITFRESYSWNVHFVSTDNLRIDHVKVFSSMSHSNGDGFDVDGCNDVLAENCLIFAEDDAITPKTSWTQTNSAKNYVFRNCVLWSQNATGIRIGDETRAPEFANMLFENIDILRSNTMIRLNNADGGDVHDITFRNIWCEEYTMHVQDLGYDEIQRLVAVGKKRDEGQTYTVQLYMHHRKPESPTGLIRNVLLENLHTPILVKSKFSGMERADGQKAAQNITFKNYIVNGQCQTDLKAAKISVDDNTQGVTVVCE